jgi:Brp/Blh family beta-carotene 15,15'-monooxygenase
MGTGSRTRPRGATVAATGPCGPASPGTTAGRTPLTTAATWSRWVLSGTAVVAGGHLIGLPAVPAPVVLALAGLGLVAGVPHGAADHAIVARLAGDRPVAAVAAVYAGAAAGVWALLRWADPAALIAVVILSGLHFGLGELEVARRLTGWRPPHLVALAVAVAGTGALLLPLARSGDQLRAVATTVSPGLARALGWAPMQTGLVAVWLLAALVAVVASLRTGHPAVALDVLILGAVGLLAPPLLAFAVWFGGWHSLRHCARLLTIEPGCAALLTTGRRREAVLRLIRLAAVPSLAAWTALAALAWLTASASDPPAVLAQVLRLLLALTVPHALVVLWADRNTRRTDVLPDPPREGHAT